MLERLGLLPNIGRMLLRVWTQRYRYIELESCILQTPEKLNSPFLRVILGPCMAHRTYVDDCSWASETCEEALAVERCWS